MGWERIGGVREAIAQLAAQIVYGEGVEDYAVARRLAAKRLLARGGVRAVRPRTRDLPSRGEIGEALRELVREIEGDTSLRRLFAMRICALEAMRELVPFSPRLTGSVATGHVREGSDVDIHVFARDPADVIAHARRLGWTFEVHHPDLRVVDDFPVDLTVHAPKALEVRPRSRTDHRPIVRLHEAALRDLLAREHAEMWRRYEDLGVVPSLDEILADADAREDEVAPPLDPEPCDAWARLT